MVILAKIWPWGGRFLTRDADVGQAVAAFEVPGPNDDGVTIRVEATPLNPSDIGLLTGLADMSAANGDDRMRAFPPECADFLQRSEGLRGYGK